MRKIVISVVLVVFVVFVSLAFAQQWGKKVASGQGFEIYEKPGPQQGSLVVTAKIVGNYTKKEEFEASASRAMQEVKNRYSKGYTLAAKDQRVFSSGELRQPSGKALNDLKEYILRARVQQVPSQNRKNIK